MHTADHEKIGIWPVKDCEQCQKDATAQYKLVSEAALCDPGECCEYGGGKVDE